MEFIQRCEKYNQQLEKYKPYPLNHTPFTAIIYTGEIRTIKKCIHNFKQMVVGNHENTHVHAVLQEPPDKETKKEITQLLFDVLGIHLKSLIWFDKQDTTWIKTRDDLLTRLPMPVGDRWLDYLKSSGSMIEYYQMYLASRNMEDYEALLSINNEKVFRYHYAVRMRCDVMFTEPFRLDFWQENSMITTNEMHNILYRLNPDYTRSPDTIIKYISSLITPHCRRLDALFSPTCKPMSESVTNSTAFTSLFSSHSPCSSYEDNYAFLDALRKYIMTMPFVYTLRCNVVYFTSRNNWITKLMRLGISYGQYYNPSNSHWFNAESQLRNICESSGLDVIDSYLDLECKSLYEYRDENYFDWIPVDDSEKTTQIQIQVMKPDLKNQCFFFIRRS